jgi:hypothetical protein
MPHPISQHVFGLIIMPMLIGTPVFIEAAQGGRTKAQKAPSAKEGPGSVVACWKGRRMCAARNP